MEEERSRENPRPLVSGLVVDRFRSMLRDNDDVVQVYEELLSELTFNSKPIITELTIIAGEQREYAEGIADVICARILEVPAEQKLPSLYLLDSIVKNIGREYVKYFALQLPKVFCEAYNQIQSNMHQAMRHLFRTWSQVFPSSVLRKIEDELQFSTADRQQPVVLASVRNSESPSPRPPHGIHVNPKYLEARRQFQHPAAIGVIGTQKTMQTAEFEEDETERLASESPNGWPGASPKFHDIEHGIGNATRLKGYGHISSSQYDEYDFDHPEDVSPCLGRSKIGSPRSVSARTSMIEVEGPSHHLNDKVSKPLSPSRTRLRRSASPLDDRLPRDSSPWRAAEMTSVPYSRLGFGAGRAVNQDGWPERSFPSDVGTPQLDASTAYEPNTRYGKKNPRELISAYGGYGPSLEKPPKLQRVEVNSINNEATTRNWRSFEEEEYPWEDMSPTLADRSGRSSLPPSGPSSGSLSRRISLHRPDSSILEPDFGGNNWRGQTKLHQFDDSAAIINDKLHGLRFGHGSLQTNSLDGRGVRNDQFQHYHSPIHVEEPGKFPYNFQNLSRELGSRSRGWNPQLQLRVSGNTNAVNGQKPPGPYDNPPDVDLPFLKLSTVPSDSANVETSLVDKHLVLRPFSPPDAPVSWPLVHKSQPLSIHASNGPFSTESNNSAQQGPNLRRFPQRQQFEGAERGTSVSNKLLPLPHQQTGLVHMKTQFQDAYGGYVPSAPPQLLSHLLTQPLNNVQMQGQGVPVGSLPNSFFGSNNSTTMYNMAGSSLLVPGRMMPPLPPGPPPGSSNVGPASQNTGSILSGSPVSAFSGLISTLMAQGLISLTPPAPREDSVGLKFSAELLKVRHESAINALYTDLPRQCTTCGLRFKCQEEHSNHMDWHVTKNRISKNRKQKPSRKWFVNTKEWLSGAETVGTDVVPFLPTEEVLEKKEDKELAVPADEDQTVCALCGEPFEDFYSDEAEEWMYKGAVYLNAPEGLTDGLDRSLLGPIVHAKCRSDSNDGS